MVKSVPKRSASHKVRHATSSVSRETGVKTYYTEVLGPTAMASKKAKSSRKVRRVVNRFLDQVDDDVEMLDDALDGTTRMELSHEGGELDEVARGIGAERPSAKYRDGRDRRDRTQNLVDSLAAQMPEIVEAYMRWSSEQDGDEYGTWTEPETTAAVDDAYRLRVVDMFATKRKSIYSRTDDKWTASVLLRQGLVPCAVENPSVAITLRALEVYRLSHLSCPRMTVEPFVKMLCNLHVMPFKPYLSRQFSIAFDLYLAIRRNVESQIKVALGRDDPNWRLLHSCPACTYELHGEPALKFSRLITMDGNDSLKRVQRRMLSQDLGEDAKGEPVLAPVSELADSRWVGEDYYVSREEVNSWADAEPEELKGVEDSPCESRWANMNEKATSKAWGIFDETGLFIALCRHGFVLLAADMVKSGEAAKYSLALLNRLIPVHKPNLGGGYDVACKNAVTIARSRLGPMALQKNFTSLVGSFHGHGHNRLCQLSYLATYVEGLGLEDLEGCEPFFGVSNSLASSTRSATVFHRQQAIIGHFKHMDGSETYRGLSGLLITNYKRALSIIDQQPELEALLTELGVTDPAVFEEWLTEERAYLQELKREPPVETLQMEYYAKLEELQEKEQELEDATAAWTNVTDSLAPSESVARKLETARRRALEKCDKLVDLIESLEAKLDIDDRWLPGSDEWIAVGKLVDMRRYQRALDSLESLVVARIFELSKMNRSQTGYKMRKHIAKALQARSKAVRNALDRYNTAAAALHPPRRTLRWQEVVEYAFISDFDLLRDARDDIRSRPWATPAGRLAMDLHFKILRAREEIVRLNVEIPRFVTYLRDEDGYLRQREAEIRLDNPLLAHQITLHRMERGRYKQHHESTLAKLRKLAGFSGSLLPGTSVEVQIHATAPGAVLGDGSATEDSGYESGPEVEQQEDADAQLEAEEEQGIEDACEALYDICNLTLE